MINCRLIGCFIAVLCACCVQAALLPGAISILPTATNRVIQVSVTPPTNNVLVKLSQDPMFGETNGVRITIANLHSNLDYADLNITYPNGVPGGRGLSAGLPDITNEVRVLFVPVRLTANTQLPSYATNGWFKRLMFGETNGPDARNVPHSVKKYFEQNSYGHVRITGDVYPDWVTVGTPRQYTAREVWTIPELLVHDAVEAIKARTPSFFDGKKYTFVIIVMPGEFAAIYNSYYEQSSSSWDDPDGNFAGYLHIDLPVEPTSRLLSPIRGEVNTVSNSFYIQPAFRAANVLGVWIDADYRTNFYTGGSFDFNQNLITLGTPVPPGQNVVVDYSVATFYRQWDRTQAFFSASQVGSWYGTFLHEFAHGLGPHISFGGAEYIGDLYAGGDQIMNYGLMSGGNHNAKNDFAPVWSDPASMEAYTKYALGILTPYRLRYGENEVNLRLYATEEFPYTVRTKLLKVPLYPEGARARRRYWSFDYAGENYLLIELRKKGTVPGIHNFDLALPHEGVVIYEVSESDQYTIGAFWQNYVRIIDATLTLPNNSFLHPEPLQNLRSSVNLTAAPFGFDSGRFEYVHGAQWQSIGNSNLNFRLDGRGPIAIYAKFGDGLTNESPVTSANIVFNPWLDANGNGIDDAWEIRYFGSLNSANGAAGADPDGDRMSNLAEFQAGTNPTNRNSLITFSGRMADGQFKLRIPSINGVPYNVEYTRDIADPRWISLFSGISGDGSVQEFVDYRRLIGNTRFYRLTVPER